MTHAYNAGTWEVEARESGFKTGIHYIEIWGQHRLWDPVSKKQKTNWVWWGIALIPALGVKSRSTDLDHVSSSVRGLVYTERVPRLYRLTLSQKTKHRNTHPNRLRQRVLPEISACYPLLGFSPLELKLGLSFIFRPWDSMGCSYNQPISSKFIATVSLCPLPCTSEHLWLDKLRML